MAKITDKALIDVGTELIINTTLRTIELTVAGQLVAKDGASWQALYSRFIDLWTDPSYNEFPFPFYTIDVLSGQFNIGTDGVRYNDWTFVGNTRLYLRDGGWNEYIPVAPSADGTSLTGTLDAVYTSYISLGTVSTGSQLYYQLVDGGAAVDFTYDDAINQGIQVFQDGGADNRAYVKGYCREYAKKYTSSILDDTGKQNAGAGAYIVNLLLSNSDDLDIVNDDTNVITTPISPYNKMSIKYFGSAFSRDIDLVGTPRDFGIVVDCGTHSGVDGSASAAGSVLTSATGGITGADFTGGTLKVHEGAGKGLYTISGTPTGTTVTINETFPGIVTAGSFTIYPAVALNPTLKQIYTFTQAKLRQATSINEVNGGGSVIGKTATQLLNFTAKLETGFFTPVNTEGGGSGVAIEGVSNADNNTVVFYDNTYTTREFPFSAAGEITVSANLVTGGSGVYIMYITDSVVGTDDYGTSTALVLEDVLGNPIQGTISGGTINFDVDFTGNTQGGRSVNTDPIPVTLFAVNPGYAKPTITTGVITASKTIALSLVAETDRTYAA